MKLLFAAGFVSLCALLLAPAYAQITVGPVQLMPAELQDDQFAVSFQENPAHSGAIVFDQPFAPPLVKLWDVSAAPASTTSMSNLLIAAGKVFVTVNQETSSGAFTGFLFALDESNGNVVWQVATDSSSIAYDSGIIFTNGTGFLRAFDAQTGALLWSSDPSQFTSDTLSGGPIVAANGKVYMSVRDGLLQGWLLAFDEATGQHQWAQPLGIGTSATPTVSDQGVFVTVPCQYFGFEPETGTPIGRINQSSLCEDLAFSAIPTSFYRGHLYTVDLPDHLLGDVIDVNQNVVFGRFVEDVPVPAFQGKIGYFLTGTGVDARDIDTGALLWYFAGDPNVNIYTPPLVINNAVYVLSNSGQLTALDRVTGSVLMSIALGLTPNPYRAPGMAAGDGLLVVPFGTHLMAFAPAAP